VRIRDYKSDDFNRLYEIDHDAFPEQIAYSHVELQYYVRSKKCRTLVADDAGAIVGFVIGGSEPRNLGHIITIDVTPHRQRQHIGSELLSRIEEWLWSNGAEAIYLETAVDDSGARAFYERHGYFIFDRIEDYYPPDLDAFLMLKTSKRSGPATPGHDKSAARRRGK